MVFDERLLECSLYELLLLVRLSQHQVKRCVFQLTSPECFCAFEDELLDLKRSVRIVDNQVHSLAIRHGIDHENLLRELFDEEEFRVLLVVKRYLAFAIDCFLLLLLD